MKNKKVLLFSIISFALITLSVNQGLCVDALALHTPDLAEKFLTPSLKDSAVKFLTVMIGVVLSSLVIYAGLSLYNKIFVKRSAFISDDIENTLLTPKSVDSAVASFIKRNKI